MKILANRTAVSRKKTKIKRLLNVLFPTKASSSSRMLYGGAKPACNQIFYRTDEGKIVELYDEWKEMRVYKNQIVSHKYEDYGVITFASPLKILYNIFKNTKITDFILPDSVTKIGWFAFSGCSNLKQVIIPDSVTEIGSYAFSGCNCLRQVFLPDFEIEIGERIFEGCGSIQKFNGHLASSDGRCLISNGRLIVFAQEGITEYIIPDSVTKIGEVAFKDCSNLKQVIIPDSVKYIGKYAFSGCSNLQQVIIPDSVTEIGNYAFSGCSSLRQVFLPDFEIEIGERIFEGCGSIQKFNGHLASSDGRCLISNGRLIYFAPEGITEYTIPDSVTKIGEDVFKGCRSLRQVIIPDSVVEIGWWAFSGCSNLQNVIIPDSVKYIGKYAFSGCNSLKQIIIPDSVKLIGSHAFDGYPLDMP